MAWRVNRYVRRDGVCPFDEFLATLSLKEQAKVLRTVELLEEFGIMLREPYAKKLTGTDLWELCTQVGSNAYRVFYVAWVEKSFVLFHGFRKKTRKTPRREIERAERMLAEFKERTR